jgi:hypothetical protein
MLAELGILRDHELHEPPGFSVFYGFPLLRSIVHLLRLPDYIDIKVLQIVALLYDLLV